MSESDLGALSQLHRVLVSCAITVLIIGLLAVDLFSCPIVPVGLVCDEHVQSSNSCLDQRGNDVTRQSVYGASTRPWLIPWP